VNGLKILALADIHGHSSTIRTLKKFLGKTLAEIELILLVGDNTHFGSKQDIKEILTELSFAPILAIPGNVDPLPVLNYLETKKISLHAKKKKINGFDFIGIGGETTKFGVLHFEEKEFEKKLKPLFQKTNPKKTILLTHTPPAKTKLDFAYKKIHVGSTALKKIIQEFQPALHLCGHIHEAFGEIQLGKTKSINIGPAMYGHALILETGSKIKIKRINFR